MHNVAQSEPSLFPLSARPPDASRQISERRHEPLTHAPSQRQRLRAESGPVGAQVVDVLEIGLAPAAEIGAGRTFFAPSLYVQSGAPRIRSETAPELDNSNPSFTKLIDSLKVRGDLKLRDEVVELLKQAKDKFSRCDVFPGLQDGDPIVEYSRTMVYTLPKSKKLVLEAAIDLKFYRSSLNADKAISMLQGLLNGVSFMPIKVSANNQVDDGTHRLALCRALNLKKIWVEREKEAQPAARQTIQGLARAPTNNGQDRYVVPALRRQSERAQSTASSAPSNGSAFRPTVEAVEHSPPMLPSSNRRFSPYRPSPEVPKKGSSRGAATNSPIWTSPGESLAEGLDRVRFTGRVLTYGEEPQGARTGPE